MRQTNVPGGQSDLGGERCFLGWQGSDRLRNHFLWGHIQSQAPLLQQDDNFPNADGRKPKLVIRVLKNPGDPWRQLGRLRHAPNPDVRLEQQSHERSTSQSDSSLAGATMSPRM